MTDSEKLRTLADWFDARDLKEGKDLSEMEVQKDLRRIADRLDKENVGKVYSATAGIGVAETNPPSECGPLPHNYKQV